MLYRYAMEFPVSFNESFATTSYRRTMNSFALYGDGAIAFEQGRVVVRGRERKLFHYGKDVELNIAIADVRNVLHAGAMVRFEAPSAAGSPQLREAGRGETPFITLWARDAAEAGQLVAALGGATSTDFQGVFSRPLYLSRIGRVVIGSLVAVTVMIAVVVEVGWQGLSARPRAERESRAALDTVSLDDTRTRRAVDDAITRVKARQIGPEEAARKIEQDAVAVLGRLERRLSAVVDLDPQTTQGKRHHLIQRYVGARKEGYAAMAQAIRANDAALLKKSRAHLAESAEIVKQLDALGGR